MAEKENPDEKPTKPKIIGGPGKMNPSTGKKFSKDYQPDPKKVSEGIRRTYALRELLGLRTGSMKTKTDKDYRTVTAAYFGIEEDQVTVKMVMEFRQIEKAIRKSDTSAFVAVMDRAYGKPPQAEPEISDKPLVEGQTSKVDLGNGIILEL